MQRPTMKRWHAEFPKIYREWKKHYLIHVESNIDSNRVPGRDPYQIECVCDQQKGRFRKSNALGCRRARCQLCHSYKYPKRLPARDELRANLEWKEAVEKL
jgi:hypothetical protein